MEVDLVTGAHLSGNRVVHRELVIVLQGPCGASVSGGACGACFSHVCGESTRGGVHRIMVGGGAHLTSFAVLAARTSVGVHPASFCRDRSTCASGEVHRVRTYQRSLLWLWRQFHGRVHLFILLQSVAQRQW